MNMKIRNLLCAGSLALSAAILPACDDPDPDTSAEEDRWVWESSEACGFSDLITKNYLGANTEHWAKPMICYLKDRGVVGGYDDGTFRPDAKVTRAEFAVMLNRALSLTPRAECKTAGFTDVTNGNYAWAADSIERAANACFLRGYPDGTFKPGGLISRLEVMVAIANGLKMTGGLPKDVDKYKDGHLVPAWARIAVSNAIDWGILPKPFDEPLLDPMASTTRAGVSRALFKTLSLYCSSPEHSDKC
jgi:hypothetical protein